MASMDPRAEQAERVLRDTIIAASVSEHIATALWAAADSYARAKVREALALLPGLPEALRAERARREACAALIERVGPG